MKTGFLLNQLGFLPGASMRFRYRPEPGEEPPAAARLETIDPRVRWFPVADVPLRPATGGTLAGEFPPGLAPADYRLVAGSRASRPFVIRPGVHDPLVRLLLLFFRWERCGHEDGWAGRCHLDPCPLVGTDRTIDVSGGYHQSADLRCWSGGCAGAAHGIVRTLFSPLGAARRAEMRDEIAWAAEHFVKVVSPAGYVYDQQFEPIGWAPRNVYDRPAPMPENFVVGQFLAAAALAVEGDLRVRCLAAAERIRAFVDATDAFDVPYAPPIPDLPAGSQSTNFYHQSVKGSATWHALRVALNLALHEAEPNPAAFDAAVASARALASLQRRGDDAAGLFENLPGSADPAFRDCSYNSNTAGELVFADLLRAAPDHPDAPQWRAALTSAADAWARVFDASGGDFLPQVRPRREGEAPGPRSVPFGTLAGRPLVIVEGGVCTAARGATVLAEAETLCGRSGGRSGAQRWVDFLLGDNPDEASYVNGLGDNPAPRHVFGQFFPSTPFLPGAMPHIRGGEVDLPAAGSFLRLLASLS